SDALAAVLADAKASVEPLVDHQRVGSPARAVLEAIEELSRRAASAPLDPATAQANARALAIGAGTTYACARLCAQGAWAAERGSTLTAAAAMRLAQRGLVPAPASDDLALAMDEERAHHRDGA
ncbi:MAG: hypothetical protein ACRDKZ_12775, partial [Actinomycetota bacterium]